MTETGAEEFRELAKTYAELHDEITKASKVLRELKKQKDGIGEHVLVFMKTNNLDECQLPDGSKINRKISRRTSVLKKELILEEFVKLVGNEATATTHLNNILSKREVIEKDVISRSMK